MYRNEYNCGILDKIKNGIHNSAKIGQIIEKMVKKLIKKTVSILQLQKDKFTYF